MLALSRPSRGTVAVRACLIAVVLAGCARRATPGAVALPPSVNGPYRVQPGDVVEVKFRHHPDENQKQRVQPDGKLGLHLAHDLHAAGLTTDELAEAIRARSSRFLREPIVHLVVVESVARAYVGGEVAEAGYVALGKPVTVLQAIVERGGFTAGADLGKVAVISKGPGARRTMRLVNVGTLNGQQPASSILLVADDVVVVPKTGIASANLVVEQWIDGLTPQLLKGVRIPTTGTGSSR